MSAEQLAELTAQIASLTRLVADQSAALGRLTAPQAPKITIAELFAKYSIVRQHASNWRHIKNPLLPLVRRLGTMPAADLSHVGWAEHRSVRATELHHRGQPPTLAGLNRELERAKEMMKWGVLNGLLVVNPLATVKAERGRTGRETWLSDEDVAKLLEAATCVRDRRIMKTARNDWRARSLKAFILVCVDTGLRKNEAIQLRWDRIEANGVVELLARQTKSRRRRIVALTPRALAAIHEIRSPGRHTPTGAVNPELRANRIPWVFLNHDTGEHLSDKWMGRWFRVAVELAGLDDKVAPGDGRLRIHDLRHTHASLADARGASSTAIRDALGHSNLSITQRYLHRHQARGALELARLMDPGASKEVA